MSTIFYFYVFWHIAVFSTPGNPATVYTHKDAYVTQSCGAAYQAKDEWIKEFKAKNPAYSNMTSQYGCEPMARPK